MERDRSLQRLPLEGESLVGLAEDDAMQFAREMGFFDPGGTFVSVDNNSPADMYRVGDSASGYVLTGGQLPEPFLGRMTGLPFKDGEGSFSLWHVRRERIK